MADVVVTVPKDRWKEWLDEGGLPGDTADVQPYNRWQFTVGRRPNIEPGERVYVVAHGKLRGFAPLISIYPYFHGWALVRGSDAVAVTIREEIPGFRGFRYRWWDRADERPFPDFMEP